MFIILIRTVITLLLLNTTPSNDGSSPAYKMYHRSPRTSIPATIALTFHAVAQNSKVKKTYNQYARDLTNIEPGTTVRVRIDKEKSWSQKGKVVKKCKQPSAYQVMNEKGNIVRRNRRHLLPTTESFKVTSDYDDLQTSFKPSDDNTSRPTTISRYGRPLRASSKYADFKMSY